MQKHLKTLSGIFFLLTPFSALGAEAILSLTPANGSHEIGKTFSVNIVAQSGEQKINAVEAGLSFDSTALSVQEIKKDGSPLTLWTTEPEFSNTGGTISLGGGNPSSFSGTKTIAVIIFKSLKTGDTTVSFSSGSVLAADGKGTDILAGRNSGVYSILKSVPIPPQTASTPKSFSDLPLAPTITSSTHPSAENWYSASTTIFSWELPDDVTAVQLKVDKNEKSTPTISYTPPILTKEVVLEDGIWYVHIRFKNDGGWGEITSRKILIDTKSPLPFTLEFKNDERSRIHPTILLSAVDELSGIDHYEIKIGEKTFFSISLSELNNSYYEIGPQTAGTYTVIVKAFDKAGNSIQTEKEITFSKEQEPKLPVQVNATGESDTSSNGIISLTFSNITILILIIVIVTLIRSLIQQKKKCAQERENLKVETEEVSNEMNKVFQALRDEVEEKIHELDNKPQLSDAEQNLLSKLKEAIDISEELIEKEIEDVVKILKK